jgi:hypothetical protein
MGGAVVARDGRAVGRDGADLLGVAARVDGLQRFVADLGFGHLAAEFVLSRAADRPSSSAGALSDRASVVFHT